MHVLRTTVSYLYVFSLMCASAILLLLISCGTFRRAVNSVRRPLTLRTGFVLYGLASYKVEIC